MDFRFAAARKLYEQKLHPRVMLGPDDLVQLRDQIRAGAGLKILEALRRKVAPLVDETLAAQDLGAILRAAKSWNSQGYRISAGLNDITMTAVLDRDERALDAVRRFLALAKDWQDNSRIVGLSPLAYDLAHEFLDDDCRRAFRALALGMIRRRLEVGRNKIFKVAAHNLTLIPPLQCIHYLLAIKGDPGVPDLAAEERELVLMLEASLHVAIGPDGYPEEDIGYGTSVGASLAGWAETLRRAGVYDPYAACPRYAKFGRAMLHFVQPWGEDLSNTGDHGDDFQRREFVLARQAAENQDPSLLWLLGTLHYTHGKVHPVNLMPDYYVEVPLRHGFRAPATWQSLLVLDQLAAGAEKHPAELEIPTQFRDRARGIVSFRSGWDADALLLLFDGAQRSPGGPGHFHDSCGSFTISALGEYFAIDCGRYTNEQNQHNLVLVDGKSGRSLDGEWCCNYCFGRLTDYQPGKLVDSAAVDSSHQHNCFWAWRHIGLVKGDRPYVWTVEDVNKNNDFAEFWWTLNTSPENTIATAERSATITGWMYGNLLDVHFALPMPDSYPRPHTLEVSQDVMKTAAYKYIPDPDSCVNKFARPADMVHGPVYVRPRLVAKVSGYNGRFMSIMLPRRPEETPAVVERLPAIDNSLAVKISFPEYSDTLIFAYEHNLLEAAGVSGRGQWCLVRRAAADGRVLAWELGNGTSLYADGTNLQSPQSC